MKKDELMAALCQKIRQHEWIIIGRKQFLHISKENKRLQDLLDIFFRLARRKKDVELLFFDRQKLIEELSALEHEQWSHWSEAISKTTKLPDKILERWRHLWRSYNELLEQEKELDRKWARKVMEILETHSKHRTPGGL